MLEKMKKYLAKPWALFKSLVKLLYFRLLDLFVSKDDYLKLLNFAMVPESLHEQAVASLIKSRNRYWSDVIFFKLTAPFVVPFALLKMKWEDNELPKWATKWNNNISIHGDRMDWEMSPNGYGVRQAAPLDKDVRHNSQGRELCYYRKGNPHVREKLSMYVWLGLRNGGAGRALQAGESVAGQVIKEGDNEKFNVMYWGHRSASKKDPGICVLTIGGHWQITYFRVIKTFKFRGKTYNIGLDTNYGYKVNIIGDYDPRDPAARLCLCHTTVPFRVKQED